MPKNTFYNLPDEKKNRIIEAAYNEFTSNKYDNVTIAGIATGAQIPIGSFYQYFQDKDDLYLYLFLNIELRILEVCVNKDKAYSDMKDSLAGEYFTRKELAFYDTWFHVPVDVMRKFYFGEYDDSIFDLCRADLDRAKKEGRLNDYGVPEFILYWYVTSTFNLYMYCKKYNIEDEKKRLELKMLFFDEILAHGIFKKKEMI